MYNRQWFDTETLLLTNPPQELTELINVIVFQAQLAQEAKTFWTFVQCIEKCVHARMFLHTFHFCVTHLMRDIIWVQSSGSIVLRSMLALLRWKTWKIIWKTNVLPGWNRSDQKPTKVYLRFPFFCHSWQGSHRIQLQVISHVVYALIHCFYIWLLRGKSPNQGFCCVVLERMPTRFSRTTFTKLHIRIPPEKEWKFMGTIDWALSHMFLVYSCFQS